GLYRRDPLLALAMMALMFSTAGVPPLVGFWAKLRIFQVLWESDHLWLVVIAAAMSVVGAYYYLRVIKLMYFDEPTPQLPPARSHRSRPTHRPARTIALPTSCPCPGTRAGTTSLSRRAVTGFSSLTARACWSWTPTSWRWPARSPIPRACTGSRWPRTLAAGTSAPGARASSWCLI